MKNTMKDKRLWILLAILGNLALVPMVWAAPAGGEWQRSEALIYHCCKKTQRVGPTAANRCCVFRFNCLDHEICERTRATSSDPFQIALVPADCATAPTRMNK